jgi:hypothetical protein
MTSAWTSVTVSLVTSTSATGGSSPTQVQARNRMRPEALRGTSEDPGATRAADYHDRDEL